MRNGIFHLVSGTAVAIALSASPAFAQKKYDTGATDTEIKIGQTVPFSGPASAYATIGKAQAAYIKMINDQGGVNGRKINFIQYDDAYSPPKTVEQVRKLVESDEVLFVFSTLGTPSNTAIQRYLNAKKVPQLFVATGATKWNDPTHYPWTIGWQPNYQSEMRIYAEYLVRNHPEGMECTPKLRHGKLGTVLHRRTDVQTQIVPPCFQPRVQSRHCPPDAGGRERERASA